MKRYSTKICLKGPITNGHGTGWANGGEFLKRIMDSDGAGPTDTLLSAENKEPKMSRKIQECILSHDAFLARDRVPHAGAT